MNPFNDGDSFSETSNQSRSKLNGSLLDRIRAQRGEAPAGQMIVGPAAETTPSQISIPNYGPAAPPAHDATDLSELGSSSIMSGFAGTGMSESLLGGQPHPPQNNQHYSMTEYFQTFVTDIYRLFRSLPIFAQVVLLIFLIFLVIKWI